MATTDEQQQAARLLKIHRRNLGRLEERKASLAGEVNLGIENQIEQERADIAALEPLVKPAPSPKVQELVQQTTSGDINNAMLFLQGVQANARMTKQEEHATKQDEQTQLIIQEQARASLWRMQTKEAIDALVLQSNATEQSRRDGARWYRRALVIGLSMSILALLVSCAAFAAVMR